jgi:hypothetical protein
MFSIDRKIFYLMNSFSQIDGRILCFNQHCPGYVQINSQIPLGWAIENTSVVGGEQFAIKLRINKV